jgi:hypothetical protein
MTPTPDETIETQPPFDADVLLALLCETGIGRAMVRGLRPLAAAHGVRVRPLPRRRLTVPAIRRPGTQAAGAGGGGPGRLAA